MANTIKLGTDSNWAVKEGSTLAYNDENGNFKPLPFNFERSTSATRVNKQGLIEVVSNNEPRIDFKDDSKGALLLEPTRSNFILYSQDFSNAAWNTSSTRSVDFVPTSTIDPQGKTNAYRVTSTASNNQVAIFGSIVLGQTYTNSIYIRRVSGSGDIVLRNINNEENHFQVSVDDGWKRIETSATSTSTFGRLYINLKTVGDAIEIWGGQVEQGSYATSYIPTQGSVVTRVAEVCNNAGNEQVINSTEGVLYVEALLKDTGTFKTAARITATDISTSDGLWIYFRSDNKIQSVLRVDGVDQVAIMSSVQTTDEYYKVAFKFKQNDFALWVNGTEIATDTSGNTFSADTLSKLGFVLSTSTNPFIGNVKDVRVYNEALTDAQLQALTS